MNKKTRSISKLKKINVTILLVLLLIFVTIAIPSFCKLLTEEDNQYSTYWDGTVALSYSGGDGSIANPYLITTPNEFAYFKEQINEGNNYEGIYFKITNNLYFNKGVIEYNNDQIIYILNSIKYYIKPYTNEYYKDSNFSEKVGSINSFSSIETFRGTLDGDENFLYGIYISSAETTETNLFSDYQGTLKNLYISNSVIYGNEFVGLINNASDATINNLLFNGSIINKSQVKTIVEEQEDIELTELEETIYLKKPVLEYGSKLEKIILKGNLNGAKIIIDEETIEESSFEIEYSQIPEYIKIEATELTTSITDLVLEINYSYNITSLIITANNSTIKESMLRGNIIGDNIVGGYIGKTTGNLDITNSYSDASIASSNIASGIIGITEAGQINLDKVYNSGTILSDNCASGLIGEINSSSQVTISNSFNSGKITGTNKGAIIGEDNNTEINNNNNYYTNSTISSIASSNNIVATNISINNLLLTGFFTEKLTFSTETWNIIDGDFPALLVHDNSKPIININLLEYKWDDIKETYKEIYIYESTKLNISYEDTDSDILKVEYYISDTAENIENIEPLNFSIYNDDINLENNGKYFVVIKVTDVVGNEKIVATDVIIIDGYNVQITDIYNNSLKSYNNQITDTSSIKFNYDRTYNTTAFPYEDESYYTIATTTPLNDNVVIKLIDNINKKIYSYIVNSEDVNQSENTYLYDLSLFKEIGSKESKIFDNKVINYYTNNKLQENFDIIFDFKNAGITENKEVTVDLQVRYNNTVYSKSYNNLDKTFSVLKYDDEGNDSGYNIILETTYADYIDMSYINSYDIELVSSIINSKYQNYDIYDEFASLDNLNLEIKLVDSENKIITGTPINGISFDIEGISYYAESDGITKIPLNSTNNNLKVNINYVTSELINGVYYLKLSSYNTNNISSNEITIPVNINNQTSTATSKFLVDIDQNDRLLLKTKEETLNGDNSIDIKIDYDGKFTKPNVRIMLYKKLNFDSNNQTYELVDLKDYMANALESNNELEYYLINNLNTTNNISLELLINNFNYGGYKFVFLLYDGDTYVKKISKSILVK